MISRTERWSIVPDIAANKAWEDVNTAFVIWRV